MYEFKVGDKVKIKGGLKLSVNVGEAEITGITEDGLYELSVPITKIALHKDYLELVEEMGKGKKFFTGKAVYIGKSEDFGFTVGKIYDFDCNGFTCDDDGDFRPLNTDEGLYPDELRKFGFVAIVE